MKNRNSLQLKDYLMKKCVIIVAGVLIFFTAVNISAQDSLIQKIDDYMTNLYESDMFSGNVLVAKEGKVIYQKSFGLANKELKISNAPETKFNIGSIGKLFTSIAVFQLVQAGKLELTDPIGRYLTNIPEDKKAITIRQLLLHTSGLGNYMAHPDYMEKMSEYGTIDKTLPLIFEEPLLFPPGDSSAYSNSGFIVLGAVIEKVAGVDYADFVKDNIWTPAGMGNTILNKDDEKIENRAVGYIKTETGSMLSNANKEPTALSDGGAYSTVGDLLKFDLAVQGDVLLDKKHRQLWFTPQGGPSTFGFATVEPKRSFSGKGAYGAMGGIPGASAVLHHVREDNYTIVVLSNYDRIAMRAGMDIEAILYGKK